MERIFSKEEIEAMNYIFGKEKDNKIFTKRELELIGNMNLLNNKLVNLVKIIWDNRNNKERMEYFQKVVSKNI